MISTISSSRALVAVADPLSREALSVLLSEMKLFTKIDAVFAKIDAVGSFQEARHHLFNTRYDLAVLDSDTPGMERLACAGYALGIQPELRIVVISSDFTPATIADGIKVGIRGFLKKDAGHAETVSATQFVLSGGLYVPPGLLMKSSVNCRAKGKVMTARESIVLQLICKGFSHKEIARALNLAEITVKVDTQRIVKKLGVRNRSVAIATAVREGIA